LQSTNPITSLEGVNPGVGREEGEGKRGEREEEVERRGGEKGGEGGRREEKGKKGGGEEVGGRGKGEQREKGEERIKRTTPPQPTIFFPD
jgi:hypothetical protein